MPGCLNSAWVVIIANPYDSLIRRQAVQDCQRGQRSSRATDAASADNLDALPVVRTAESLVQCVEGLDAVIGNPEIAPTNVAVRPARWTGVAQNQGEVRGANLVTGASSAHSWAGRKSDEPTVVLPWHHAGAGAWNPTPGLVTSMISIT